MAGRLFSIAVLLLTPAFASAAARTTSQAGDWTDTATWGGSAAPVDGDTATVNHAVAVTTTCTVGTAGATGTDAITMGSAGSITISTGELICKGDIEITGSGTAADKLWVQRGGTLTMNAATGVTYAVYLGTGTTQRARMRVGDSGTGRATVRKTGLGIARITAENGATTRGGLYGDDCDFEDLGSTGSTNAIWILASQTDDVFYLDSCTFDGCGRVGNNGSTLNASATCYFTDCKWTNSLDTRSVSLGGGDSDVIFTRCSFDGQLYLIGPAGVVVTDCYCGQSVTGTGSGTLIFSVAGHNLMRKTGSGGSTTNVYADLTNCYCLWDGTATNPHGWMALADRNHAWTGNIIEYTGSDTSGDLFQITNPAAARVFTYTGNILLPNGAGTNPGSFISFAAAGANVTAAIEHNTFASSNGGSPPETAIKYGETYAGHSGMISSLKSNLAYGVSAGVGLKLQRMSTSTTQNIVSAANCTHNGGYQLADGSEYGQNPGASARGYNCGSTATDIVSSGQLGANDVEGDPDFVDDTRNIATWYVAGLGNTTTGTTAGDRAASLAILANDPTQIEDLYLWVRGGFVPTNVAFDGTAHDGGDIGAMPYAAANKPVAKILLQLSNARLRKQTKHFDTYGVYALTP